MGILMVGVIVIRLDFAQGFQKCIILGVLSELESPIGHQSEVARILTEERRNRGKLVYIK